MAGEDRRTFLELITAAAAALSAAIVGIPVIGAVFAPFRKTTVTGAGDFVAVAKVEAVPEDGTPVQVPVVVEAPRDAWVTLPPTQVGAVFLRRQGAELVAYSTICPHLGCGIDFVPEGKRFACPCHESAFGLDGSVSGGPSPRGLDRLETRTREGSVEVRFLRFAQGTKDKVPI